MTVTAPGVKPTPELDAWLEQVNAALRPAMRECEARLVALTDPRMPASLPCLPFPKGRP